MIMIMMMNMVKMMMMMMLLLFLLFLVFVGPGVVGFISPYPIEVIVIVKKYNARNQEYGATDKVASSSTSAYNDA